MSCVKEHELCDLISVADYEVTKRLEAAAIAVYDIEAGFEDGAAEILELQVGFTVQANTKVFRVPYVPGSGKGCFAVEHFLA